MRREENVLFAVAAEVGFADGLVGQELLAGAFQGDGSNYKSKTTINESGLYSLVQPVRPSPARRGASAPRRAVLPRTRGMQSYALLARPTP